MSFTQRPSGTVAQEKSATWSSLSFSPAAARSKCQTLTCDTMSHRVTDTTEQREAERDVHLQALFYGHVTCMLEVQQLQNAMKPGNAPFMPSIGAGPDIIQRAGHQEHGKAHDGFENARMGLCLPSRKADGL